MTSPFSREISVAVDLVRKAAAATEWIRQNGIREMTKEDGTPLTQADIVSQAIILAGLGQHFPDDRIEAEEAVSADHPSALETSACEVLGELGFKNECENMEQSIHDLNPCFFKSTRIMETVVNQLC